MNWFKRWNINRLKRDEFESKQLRAIFLEKYQIDIGMYSYGCFDQNRIARGTVIGRYCSFAQTAVIFNGNHGLEFLTTHPYIYNPSLGLVESETILRSKCIVSDDVWLGHNSIVTPRVENIGRGAVIAAGAVVTKNVPAYAIVAGNPAKVVKYRFSPGCIEQIEKSEWWNQDFKNLKELIKSKPELVYNPANYFLSGMNK